MLFVYFLRIYCRELGYYIILELSQYPINHLHLDKKFLKETLG